MSQTKVNLGEYLEEIKKGKGWVIVCKRCGHVYCRWDENPKEHAVMKEEPLTKAGRLHSESDRFGLRQFFCPGCATLFATDVIARGSSILWETRLTESGN